MVIILLKRALLFFILILIGIFVGGFRIYYWATNETFSTVAVQNSSYALKVASVRGNIYDFKNRPLVNETTQQYCAVFPSIDACTSLASLLPNGEILEYIQALNSAKPFCIKLQSNQVINAKDTQGLRLFTVPSRHTKETESIMPHVLGYLDSDGDGVCGLEKSFNSHLKSCTGTLKINYKTDALGRIFSQSAIQTEDSLYKYKAGVVLTINKSIQRIVHDIAKENIKKGAIIVTEVPNCEVRALVSMPEFNLADIGSSLNKDDSPFLNRALANYNAGSVYKLVTAMALLEENIPGLNDYSCEGSITLEDTCFHCANCKAHGIQNLEKALSNSCNTYFINFAKKLNPEKFYTLSKNLGFGSCVNLAPDYESSSGVIPSSTELKDEALMANTSFGQGTLMVTPLQISALINTVATGGKYIAPSLVKGLVNSNLEFTQKFKISAPKQIISEKTAEVIKNGMLCCVESGTGVLGNPEIVKAAAKTSTAQTGIIIDGRNILQGWFAGFYPFKNPKYCIVILAEDVQSGGLDCGPIFKKIVREIIESEK